VADLFAIRRLSLVLVASLLFSVAGAREAAAQGFISPFLGYNFSGQSGCQQITNCSDKRTDYGVSLGTLGSILGFEAELGYTKNFFGESSAQTSNVLTFMGNLMLGPRIGPVQPYGVFGLGLIRTTVEATLANSTSDQNQFGWDGGGGVIIMFNPHVGIRGDVRYFRTFDVLSLLNNFPNLPPSNSNLDYGRFAGAFVFKF